MQNHQQSQYQVHYLRLVCMIQPELQKPHHFVQFTHPHAHEVAEDQLKNPPGRATPVASFEAQVEDAAEFFAVFPHETQKPQVFFLALFAAGLKDSVTNYADYCGYVDFQICVGGRICAEKMADVAVP